jgi:hypothetical protein
MRGANPAASRAHQYSSFRIMILGMAAALIAGALAAGCASPQANTPAPPTAEENLPGLDELAYVPTVNATCPVPAGWQAQPLKQNERHTHQVWISPSGKTAFGVIHFKLPLPVGPDLALAGFLSAMQKSEGNANLIERHSDSQGIQFIVEGGVYRMHAQLIVKGYQAWAIYAATRRAEPTVSDELKLAELAAGHTQINDAEPPIRQAQAGEE